MRARPLLAPDGNVPPTDMFKFPNGLIDFLDSDPRFQSILQRINLPVTSIANPTR